MIRRRPEIYEESWSWCPRDPTIIEVEGSVGEVYWQIVRRGPQREILAWKPRDSDVLGRTDDELWAVVRGEIFAYLKKTQLDSESSSLKDWARGVDQLLWEGSDDSSHV